MIQRRQTVYLLLVCVLGIWMLMGDLSVAKGKLTHPDGYFYHYHFKVSHTELISQENESVKIKNSILPLSVGLSLLVAAGSIFLYKRLELQKQIVMVCMVFTALIYAVEFYYWFRITGPAGYRIESTDFSVFTILPLISLICTFLAYSGIRKDIELLASANRLR